MRKWILLLLILAAGRTVLSEDLLQRLTVEDYLQLPMASSPAISPQGSHVAFVVRRAELERNRFVRSVWMVRTDGTGLVQLTQSIGEDFHPQWSPDGNSLAFLSTRPYFSGGVRREGVAQIWLVSLAGGEARRLSDATEGVLGFRWSPSAQVIYYTTRKPPSAEERRKQEEDKQKGFDAIVVGEPKRPVELWALDLRENRGQRVAELDPGVNEMDVDPTGRWLVYATNYTGELDDEQKYDLWLIDLTNGERRQLTDFPGPETSPAFSPDGHWIAYVAQTVPDIEFAETDIWVIPVTGGSPRCLTGSFGYAARNPGWTADGNAIIFEAAIRTYDHLLQARLRDGGVEMLATGEACFTEASVARRRGLVACIWENATSLPEIGLLDLGKRTFQPLTHFSSDLRRFQLGRQTVLRWTSEGYEIEGILIYPPGYEEGAPVPLIVAVHGGPFARFRNVFRQGYMLQVLAGRGYAILAPNPRGSSGYGDRFGQANRYDLGGGDFRDILAGVDQVVRLGVADSNRLGVMGGSYGGYMTNWIISQTDRFRAAVSMYGIFSLLTDWSNSVQPSWEKMYLGSYYWEDLQPYLERSPAFHVQKIRTPVLILHGEEDDLTAVANSREMYQALRVLGRTVKFVVYPREGHGIDREPNHLRDRTQRILEWFDTYLRRP
ncbi:MAG: S9 family peptidase [candidate division KSB1 bacterium]|nr:S9 family peptidase [candidate division KSB1 bacterium]